MNGSTAASFAGMLLTAGLLLWVFTPSRGEHTEEKTRLGYLRERKDAVYENLRDLNFEYKAGKLSDNDYDGQRAALETEAGAILAEIEQLEAVEA